MITATHRYGRPTDSPAGGLPRRHILTDEQTEQWREFENSVDTIRPDRLPCELDPDIYYSIYAEDRAIAIAMCGTCPLIEQCRPLAAHEKFGVWAGVSLDTHQPAECGNCGRWFYPEKQRRYCHEACSRAAKNHGRKQVAA